MNAYVKINNEIMVVYEIFNQLNLILNPITTFVDDKQPVRLDFEKLHAFNIRLMYNEVSEQFQFISTQSPVLSDNTIFIENGEVPLDSLQTYYHYLLYRKEKNNCSFK